MLKPLVSDGMITKLADENITLEILQKAYKDNEEHGVENLLVETVNGKPRVTKNKRVVSNIIEAVRKTLPPDQEVRTVEQ